MNCSNFDQWKLGVRHGVPICMGYLAVSFAVGLAAVSAGMSIFQSGLMSLTNMTSAGEVAGIGLIAAGAPYFEMALTQLVVNIRYLLMSFSFSQKIDNGFPSWHRFLVAFGLTDEIYGVAASQSGKVSPFYNYGMMSVAIPGWTLGTLTGAMCGSLVPQMVTSALGIAIYAMFLAVIVPPARRDRAILLVVLAAMALGVIFRFAPVLRWISSGFSIIIITVAVAAAAAVLRPVKDTEGASDAA